jgi:hypothetical protein
MWVYNLIIRSPVHANVCKSKEETWATNANAFVAQEEDETQAYSVRVAGFDLLAVCPDIIEQANFSLELS